MAFPIWLIAAPASRDNEDEASRRGRGRPQRIATGLERAHAPSLEDVALTTRLRAGDPEAFESLYVAHFQGLWEFAARYVRSSQGAEDVVQDVFSALWLRRATLEPEAIHLRPYLYAAVRNRALRERQRDTRGASVAHVHAAQPIDQAQLGPDTTLLNEDVEVSVARVLATLSPTTAELILLRWKHGMEYADIARVLGISPAAAQKQGRRVLTALWPRLRRLLGD